MFEYCFFFTVNSSDTEKESAFWNLPSPEGAGLCSSPVKTTIGNSGKSISTAASLYIFSRTLYLIMQIALNNVLRPYAIGLALEHETLSSWLGQYRGSETKEAMIEPEILL